MIPAPLGGPDFEHPPELMSVASLHPAVARQCGWRYESPARIGLKINLYHGWEVASLTEAATRYGHAGCPLECLMVGDSYFMTYLGRPSTRLNGPRERREGVDILAGLLAEVRAAMTACFAEDRRPYLIGDLPDGSGGDPDTMLGAADRFVTAGADVVKLEVTAPDSFRCVEAAARQGIPIIAHLGYTPQAGSLARYGDTLHEALAIFALARRARDAGACALVLEMVSEQVNRALSTPNAAALPIYSIFSGRAAFGGQSLNTWDAVFHPVAPRRYFPPTAVLDPRTQRDAYTPELLSDCLARLLRLTLAGCFPRTPSTAMTQFEQERLLGLDPWEWLA